MNVTETIDNAKAFRAVLSEKYFYASLHFGDREKEIKELLATTDEVVFDLIKIIDWYDRNQRALVSALVHNIRKKKKKHRRKRK